MKPLMTKMQGPAASGIDTVADPTTLAYEQRFYSRSDWTLSARGGAHTSISAGGG